MLSAIRRNRKTIPSILNKTPNLEFIIIDGGSNDQTMIIEGYRHVLSIETNKDNGQACNKQNFKKSRRYYNILQ